MFQPTTERQRPARLAAPAGGKADGPIRATPYTCQATDSGYRLRIGNSQDGNQWTPVLDALPRRAG